MHIKTIKKAGGKEFTYGVFISLLPVDEAANMDAFIKTTGIKESEFVKRAMIHYRQDMSKIKAETASPEIKKENTRIRVSPEVVVKQEKPKVPVTKAHSVKAKSADLAKSRVKDLLDKNKKTKKGQ